MTKPLPYSVVLTQEERDKLTAISGTPSQQMRTVRRAYILLMLDRGLSAPEISRQLGIVRASVYNCVKRYREGGIERAIYDGARPGGPRRISDEAIQWMRSVAAMPPGLVGINAERWTVTMLQQYIERQAEAYGFPEITSISRSRLWELLTKNGGRSVTPVITKPVPAIKTIEFYWRQTFVPVLQDVDGFWQVSYNDDVSFGPYGTDSRCPDGPCLSFITGLILTTGRLFVYPGNKEKAQDMLAFLQHLDRKTEKGCTIELLSGSPEERLPAEAEKFLFQKLGRFSLVYKNRYGSLLSITSNYVGTTCRALTLPLRGKTPEELQQKILSVINNFDPVKSAGITMPFV